jgi:hypothetical protein
MVKSAKRCEELCKSDKNSRLMNLLSWRLGAIRRALLLSDARAGASRPRRCKFGVGELRRCFPTAPSANASEVLVG